MAYCLSDCDRVQPGGKLLFGIETGDVSKGLEKSLLDQVLDILVCLDFVAEKVAQSGAVPEN